MNFSLILENIDVYFGGVWITLELVSLSLIFGFFIAIALAVLLTISNNPLVTLPIRAFVYFFRGTPLLIQMFLVYYGMGQFEAIKDTFIWDLFKEAHFCALFTFALNTGAYTTEIFRGSIVNTPLGEIEAAKAAGMSKPLMFRRIILPSALRRALPAYGNEMIFMLHGTALASVITIVDITGAARIINSRFYSPYEAFLTAAAFYMVITFTMVWGLKKLEYKWLAHLRRDSDTA
ncbi:ABC transporter permease [Desulfosediminicola flagellatus]|uniref:ABC transporter permease n=1 Tax=Desulfosediminicola flagellatus TaxID=2569541 RepID=UPI0010AD09A9|nr:ABC transporter permease [Desulfosediminicola flagellatus]